MAKKKKATKEDLPPELVDVKTVRITSLQATNILRLNFAEFILEETGALILQGENEQGKSSSLQSFAMGLAGASSTPPKPIHGNAKKGSIIARFATEAGELVVTKTFERGKKEKLVITLEGSPKPLSRPATILEVLLDHIATDPRRIVEMKGPERLAKLMEMLQIDTVAIEKERDEAYGKRTAVGHERDRLNGAYQSIPHHADAPEAEVVVSDLMASLDEIRTHNRSGETLEQAKTDAKTAMATAVAEVERLGKELILAKRTLAAASGTRTTTLNEAAAFELKDEDAVRNKIATAEARNQKLRDNTTREEARKTYMAQKDAYDTLTSTIAQLDEKKTEMLKEAQDRLPLPELGIGDDDITYNGEPFVQAGDSASTVVSAAMVMELNKDRPLKFLMIDRAESMGAKTTVRIIQLMNKYGFQGVMARVGKGELPALEIVDGMVKA